MPERRAQEFIDELVRDPDLVARLLAAHIPDSDNRCMGCAVDTTLRPPHPCGPQALAAIAQQRIRSWSVR